MRTQYEEMLRHALQNQTVVTIHYDKSDYSAVFCGYIDSLSRDECRLRMHRKYGMADGWRVFRLEDVLFLEINGQYEHRLAYFASLGDHQFPFPKLDQIVDGSIIQGTLRQAMKIGHIVSIRMDADNYQLNGYVHAISDENVTIMDYDSFGVPTGEAVVPFGEVFYVTCGSMECQRTQHLVEHQQEFLEFRRRQHK